MHPRFDLPLIQPYGLVVTLAACVAWWGTRRRATRAGIDASHIDLVVPLMFVGAGLGSRVLAVLDPADAGITRDLLVASRLRVFGLLLGAAVVLLVYARLSRLPFHRLADVLAVPAVVFLALVRIGCLMAGCCWGDVTVPLTASAGRDLTALRPVQTVGWLTGPGMPAVRFPSGSFAHAQQVSLGLVGIDAASLPVHPVQLYEAALLAILAWAVWRRENAGATRPGSTAKAALVGYCLLRFFTEFLRADNRLVLAALTMPQCVAAVVVLAFVAASVLVKPTAVGPSRGYA